MAISSAATPSTGNPTLALLATYLRPQIRRVIVLALLLLAVICAQLGIPLLLRTFIDTITGSTDAPASGALLTLAIAFASAALLQQAAAVAATYVSENIAWTATNSLRDDLAAHCLHLDMPFHNTHTPGEMIERIDGDVSALASFFSQFVIRLVANVIMLVGAIALLFFVDARIGLVVLVFSTLTLLAMITLRRFTVPWFAADREAITRYSAFAEERLHGLEDIRSSGAAGNTLSRLDTLMRICFRTSLKATFGSNLGVNLSFFLFALGVASGLSVAVYLFVQGTITIGVVYLTWRYADLIRQPIEEMTREIEGFQRASASIGRIRELRALKRTLIEPEAGKILPEGVPLRVTFERVNFAYSDAPVLHDLSFDLQPGRVLGLLGHTGSGKSTLARLLFRLYEPTSGVIRLNGIDVRELRSEHLRAHVGMVTQEVQLFHATLRDNLTLFDRDIPDDRIRTVIDDLGLGSWLAALPNGLDSELQTGGSGLSAGEAQLLAFARVFLRGQRVVVLDEATSRLDRISEHRVELAVQKLLAQRDRTLIIIAHRLSTVMRADEIMVLEAGRVLEHGARAQLQTDTTSRFAQLLRVGFESTSPSEGAA